MIYLSWAAVYEGPTDQAYFELLIPRVMEDIVMTLGTRHSIIPPSPAVRLHRGEIEHVARKACEAGDAFHLIFIHADTGGRHGQITLPERSASYCEAMRRYCAWPAIRCVAISPRHETEAWVLADPRAVTAALGFLGQPASIGLPGSAIQAEELGDPKAVLAAAVRQIRGRRRPVDVKQILPAIASRQSLADLRQSRSFRSFESSLKGALADLGCI